MATKVWTDATMVLTITQGSPPGSNWDLVVRPAWSAANSMNGATGAVAYNSPAAPTFQALLLAAALLNDDATVPAVITMTSVLIQFDYTIVCAAATQLTDAITIVAIPGGGSGSFSGTSTPLDYFGGTTRADLFAGIVLWQFGTKANSASQAITVSGFTVTVTYTTPSVTRVNPSRGSVNGGQAVTITGGGFTAATGVTFGGTAVASYVIVSSTVITAVTPEHASGLVDVEVLSVAVGVGLYTFIIPPNFTLPPLPDRTPIQQGGGARGR